MDGPAMASSCGFPFVVVVDGGGGSGGDCATVGAPASASVSALFPRGLPCKGALGGRWGGAAKPPVHVRLCAPRPWVLRNCFPQTGHRMGPLMDVDGRLC